jgi:hypothetical protein
MIARPDPPFIVKAAIVNEVKEEGKCAKKCSF